MSKLKAIMLADREVQSNWFNWRGVMIYEQIYEVYKRSINALKSLSTSLSFENKDQEILLLDLWFMKKALSKGIISGIVWKKVENWNSSRGYYYFYEKLKESEVDQISLLRRYPLSDSVVQFLFEKDYHQLLDILERFESAYLENMWRVLLSFWRYKFEKLQHLNLSLFEKYSDLIELAPLLEKGIFKVAYILRYRVGYSEYSIPNDFEELLKILKEKGFVLYESRTYDYFKYRRFESRRFAERSHSDYYGVYYIVPFWLNIDEEEQIGNSSLESYSRS